MESLGKLRRGRVEGKPGHAFGRLPVPVRFLKIASGLTPQGARFLIATNWVRPAWLVAAGAGLGAPNCVRAGLLGILLGPIWPNRESGRLCWDQFGQIGNLVQRKKLT